LLEHLAAVLEALPADGQPLAGFAARVAGGAHALDEGRPLAALALGAVRALTKLASPGPDESHTEARREAWASVGLLCDELSSIVLALGMPGEQQTASGRILGVARESGEPVWLTLRQLVRDMPSWASASRARLSGQTVFICENPVVVAHAADRLGSECAPLVCTSGQPSAATIATPRHSRQARLLPLAALTAVAEANRSNRNRNSGSSKASNAWARKRRDSKRNAKPRRKKKQNVRPRKLPRALPQNVKSAKPVNARVGKRQNGRPR
jgi:hypothetical protein